jgi:betaine-aldehyde dehydrogenase
VVAVLPFDDEADAIALANATEYGLSGSIWTDNLSRALRVSRAVDREPQRQLTLVGPVQHPVRRVQAVRAGPRARPDAPEHFTETKNVFFAMGEQ